MTLEEMKAAALNGLTSLTPKPIVPKEFQDNLDAQQAKYAKPAPVDPWNRGKEQGLNETTGLDVLREPKEIATKAMGGADNPMSQLMNMLVPDEVSPSMLSGVGVLKPKTAMKNLATKGMETWDKDAVSKAVADKLGGDKEIPMWKKKLMQPK